MKKIIYIIPGFIENTKTKSYQKIIKNFQDCNFQVIPIKISWKNKVMTDYVADFYTQLIHKNNNDVYIFGFSFGAVIAFIAASNIKPKKIILCSLSPYFREDLKYIEKSWMKIMGKNRINDFKNFSFDNLSEKINCETLLILGEKENKQVYRRTEDANKKIKKSKLFIFPGAKHNISQKEYINNLEKIIPTI